MGQVERAIEVAAMVPAIGRALRAEGVRAWLASAAGLHEEARTLAADLLARSDASWRAPESALAMLEALAALGDLEALAEQVASVRRFAGALALLTPACDRAEGLVRAGAGDLEAAAVSLRRSLDAFERLGERYESARTREALAGVWPGEEARDLLAEALQHYDELGARPDADRVRTLLGDAPTSA